MYFIVPAAIFFLKGGLSTLSVHLHIHLNRSTGPTNVYHKMNAVYNLV